MKYLRMFQALAGGIRDFSIYIQVLCSNSRLCAILRRFQVLIFYL